MNQKLSLIARLLRNCASHVCVLCSQQGTWSSNPLRRQIRRNTAQCNKRLVTQHLRK